MRKPRLTIWQIVNRQFKRELSSNSFIKNYFFIAYKAVLMDFFNTITFNKPGNNSTQTCRRITGEASLQIPVIKKVTLVFLYKLFYYPETFFLFSKYSKMVISFSDNRICHTTSFLKSLWTYLKKITINYSHSFSNFREYCPFDCNSCKKFKNCLTGKNRFSLVKLV